MDFDFNKSTVISYISIRLMISGVKYMLLLYQKHQQYTGHFETLFHIYHDKKVYTVRVMMLDDKTGVLLYRSKHFNINSHDVDNCSVDLERGTLKKPYMNKIIEKIAMIWS